ncbi:MAG TPA: hypothetical protein VJ488_00605, partial [Dehalococcoidia bacterium]|nr:hypothetical protein [Dehalococcoidia bacterium]
IKLEQGYPSPAFSRNEDPRNNAEVMQSLESAGKLVNKPSVTATGQLPHSMKGYELYSWLEEGQWHFTLVTGTNRNKTLGEIVSHVNIISEDGWVQINVAGADAIKTVLSRLPQNEQIFWLAGLRSEQMPQDNLSIMLPPAPILDTIKEHASRCSLVLQIQPAS